MREIEEKSNLNTPEFNRETDISDLERIGDFEILKEGDNGNGNGNNNVPTNIENIEADNLLEGPVTTVEERVAPKAPPNLPTENSSNKSPIKPQTSSQITSTPTTSPSPVSPPPRKSYENDPYHEPIG